MLLNELNLLFVGLTMVYTVFAEYEVNADRYVKNTFIKLLKNIVEVNERRMVALRQITKLQDYVIQTDPSSVIDDDNDGSDENLGSLIALYEAHNSATRRTRDSRERSIPANEIIIVSLESIPKLENNKENKDRDFEKDKKAEFGIEDDDKTTKVTTEDKKINISDVRRNWMGSCTKKAAKACKRACINAYKSFCRIYSCSSRAKKRLKTECKYSCNSKFKSNNNNINK